MNNTNSHIEQQLSQVASALQQKRTGLMPKAVTVDRDSIERADDDGFFPAPLFQNDLNTAMKQEIRHVGLIAEKS